MNRSALRLTLIVIAAAIAGALLTLAVVRKPQAEPDRAPTAPQAQHVTIVAGEPTIEVDEKTQQDRKSVV